MSQACFRMLLIEGNRADAALIKECLGESKPGSFALEHVDRLATGLKRLPGQQIDAVLLDLSLPDAQGLDTFRRFHSQAPHLPVVILTDLEDDPVALQAILLGAQDFLVKGQVTGRELVRCLHYARERKAAAEALRVSESLYRSLVESLPLQVFHKDRDGRFTFANTRFCDTLGQPLEQVLGKTDLDFFPQSLADKYRRDDLKVMTRGEVFEETEPYQLPTGERIFIAVFKAPVYDAQNRVVGVQGLFWDVTAPKWAEEQKTQMRVARTIQQSLLPASPPRVAGLDIWGACYPVEATGGDFFDYLAGEDGSVSIALGDVCGHGFGPALLAAVTNACLRTLALVRADLDISLVLAAANRLLLQDNATDQFVTMVFARLDAASRSLVYSSAGHPAGFVLDAVGAVKARLANTGPMLGLFADRAFSTAPPIALAPGDLLALMSDGIQETTAPYGTQFGTVRALESLRTHQHESAQEIVEALCRAASDFRADTPQLDDITAVVVKVLPAL